MTSIHTRIINAAEEGRLEVLKRLLPKTSTLTACAYDGSTALMRATERQHPQCVKLLLEHGSLVNQTNAYGRSALMCCVFKDSPAIHECMALLIAAGADLNLQNSEGKTALMLASELGDTTTMARLLEAGADSSLKDKKGRNAHKLAKFHRQSSSVALLEAVALKRCLSQSDPNTENSPQTHLSTKVRI